MQQLQHLLQWNMIQQLQRLPSHLHVLVAKFIFQLSIVDTGRGVCSDLTAQQNDCKTELICYSCSVPGSPCVVVFGSLPLNCSFNLLSLKLIKIYCYFIQPCCSEECLTTQRGTFLGPWGVAAPATSVVCLQIRGGTDGGDDTEDPRQLSS
ncbi:hypothetical protein TNCV_546711 [Trichonephila clavipes]|nr:hypothetical protein TNCV_546711 [Trichonephila clavipes]